MNIKITIIICEENVPDDSRVSDTKGTVDLCSGDPTVEAGAL